ncbi:MAG: hypothetical protein JXJ04_16305 [Spirochaetales bacterium]|nr:hypothetical protein [Spirochaetales bacterium]
MRCLQIKDINLSPVKRKLNPYDILQLIGFPRQKNYQFCLFAFDIKKWKTITIGNTEKLNVFRYNYYRLQQVKI